MIVWDISLAPHRENMLSQLLKIVLFNFQSQLYVCLCVHVCRNKYGEYADTLTQKMDVTNALKIRLLFTNTGVYGQSQTHTELSFHDRVVSHDKGLRQWHIMITENTQQ